MGTNKSKEDVAENNTMTIRIIYHGECPKLTARGKGVLGYEFGVNEATDETFIRIASNSQGGTCSYEWILLKTVEELLANREEENQTFSAILFKKAFVSRSANNHGYLAAILKAEKVIGSATEQSTLLGFLSFDSMKDQINHLKGEDVDLPDQVAAEQKAREEKKQLRRAAKLAEQKDEPVKTAAKRGRSKKEIKES